MPALDKATNDVYSMFRKGINMPQMVRKQIYIQSRQEMLLKQLSKELGLTEAELIRRGLDQGLGAGVERSYDPSAWTEAKGFIKRLVAKGPVRGGRCWKREDLYDRKISGRY
jgi:hypothetical protein